MQLLWVFVSGAVCSHIMVQNHQELLLDFPGAAKEQTMKFGKYLDLVDRMRLDIQGLKDQEFNDPSLEEVPLSEVELRQSYLRPYFLGRNSEKTTAQLAKSVCSKQATILPSPITEAQSASWEQLWVKGLSEAEKSTYTTAFTPFLPEGKMVFCGKMNVNGDDRVYPRSLLGQRFREII